MFAMDWDWDGYEWATSSPTVSAADLSRDARLVWIAWDTVLLLWGPRRVPVRVTRSTGADSGGPVRLRVEIQELPALDLHPHRRFRPTSLDAEETTEARLLAAEALLVMGQLGDGLSQFAPEPEVVDDLGSTYSLETFGLQRNWDRSASWRSSASAPLAADHARMLAELVGPNDAAARSIVRSIVWDPDPEVEVPPENRGLAEELLRTARALPAAVGAEAVRDRGRHLERRLPGFSGRTYLEVAAVVWAEQERERTREGRDEAYVTALARRAGQFDGALHLVVWNRRNRKPRLDPRTVLEGIAEPDEIDRAVRRAADLVAEAANQSFDTSQQGIDAHAALLASSFPEFDRTSIGEAMAYAFHVNR